MKNEVRQPLPYKQDQEKYPQKVEKWHEKVDRKVENVRQLIQILESEKAGDVVVRDTGEVFRKLIQEMPDAYLRLEKTEQLEQDVIHYMTEPLSDDKEESFLKRTEELQGKKPFPQEEYNKSRFQRGTIIFNFIHQILMQEDDILFLKAIRQGTVELKNKLKKVEKAREKLSREGIDNIKELCGLDIPMSAIKGIVIKNFSINFLLDPPDYERYLTDSWFGGAHGMGLHLSGSGIYNFIKKRGPTPWAEEEEKKTIEHENHHVLYETFFDFTAKERGIAGVLPQTELIAFFDEFENGFYYRTIKDRINDYQSPYSRDSKEVIRFSRCLSEMFLVAEEKGELQKLKALFLIFTPIQYRTIEKYWRCKLGNETYLFYQIMNIIKNAATDPQYLADFIQEKSPKINKLFLTEEQKQKIIKQFESIHFYDKEGVQEFLNSIKPLLLSLKLSHLEDSIQKQLIEGIEELPI